MSLGKLLKKQGGHVRFVVVLRLVQTVHRIIRRLADGSDKENALCTLEVLEDKNISKLCSDF